jgi:bisphosphoglycerate-dependent phosphoglycerate mutase
MRFGKVRKNRKIPKSILRQCKRLKIKVSIKRGSKRVKKTLKQLKREIRRRKNSFGKRSKKKSTIGIAKAFKHFKKTGTAGSFKRWCKRNGYPGVNLKCINKAKKNKSLKIRRKAIFAQNIRNRFGDDTNPLIQQYKQQAADLMKRSNQKIIETMEMYKQHQAKEQQVYAEIEQLKNEKPENVQKVFQRMIPILVNNLSSIQRAQEEIKSMQQQELELHNMIAAINRTI